MDIQVEERGPKKRAILINNTPFREVTTTIFGKKCRLPPPSEEPNEWEKAFTELEKGRALRYSAYLLSKRDYSSHKLTEKLKSALVSPSTIEEVLEKLIERGYLNDSRYAEAVITNCRARGLGEGRIRAALMAKGLPLTLLDLYPPKDPLEAAEKSWKRLKRRYTLEDPKDKQKAYAAMARRGFDWETIEKVVI